MLHAFGRCRGGGRRIPARDPLKPENAEAHNNLGRLLTSQTQFADAVGEFEQALRLDPDAVSPLAGLAWVRAVAGDPAVRQPGQAIRLAERAAALRNRKDPAVLDALAAPTRQLSSSKRRRKRPAKLCKLLTPWVSRRSGLTSGPRARLYEQQQPYIAR